MPTTPPLAKLTRPSAAGLLPRERLFSLIDAARSSRCLWVSAPAGAGKTSLISSWIEARQIGGTWYQVDTGDADPAALFHYLGIAAKANAGKKRGELPHLTPEYMPSIDVFVRRYFEAFFAGFKASPVLVLDNYQDAPPQAALHAVLDGALHALPPGAQIICLSREAPPAPLARWRANGEFKLIGLDDLRLTDDEAQGVARLSRVPDLPDTAAVNAVARGWAAGFKLLLQARAEGLDVGISGEETPQLLFDYFAKEVFDKAAPAMQDFLLKTALLPRITADVARQLSGNAAAEQILAGLHRNRLFIDQHPQAGAAPSYEYHPLSRQFLLERARRTLQPADLAHLQARAAVLLEQSGEWDAAASLWRCAEDWSALQQLVCTQAPTLLAEGRIATIEAWIDAVPALFLSTSPWLLYWRGNCHGFRDPALGRQSLAAAYYQFRASGEMPGAFLSLAGILTAYFHQWGDMMPLDPWIAEFEALLAASGGIVPPGVEAQVLGASLGIMTRRPDHRLLPAFARRATALMLTLEDENLRLAMASFVILYLVWKGELTQARALCTEVANSVPTTTSLMPRSFLSVVTGLVLWQTAEHPAALEKLSQALASANESGVHLFDPLIYLHLAYTALSMGDADAADRALDAGWAAIHPGRQIDILQYGFVRAGALLVRGRVREAIQLARDKLPPAIATGSPFGEATFRIQLGQMLMIDGQHGEAREHLERALAFARRMPSDILQFQALIALAYSHLDGGGDQAGLQLLHEALSIGSRQSYMNCHPWWIPQVMSCLCARALVEGVEVAYVQRLISTRHLDPPANTFDIEGWPWAVRIYTLGRFAVVIDGAPLHFPSKVQKKPLELLKALIAHGGRSVGLNTLAGELWPDLEGDAGQNALHLALHRLRQLLGQEDLLCIQESKLSFDSRRLWIDAWAFERLVGRAETATLGALTRNASRVEVLAAQLLRLYPGHFLRDEEAPWAIAHRERLRSKFLRLGQALGTCLEAAPDPSTAADLYRRGLELDPLAEEFHRGLIRCLQADGHIAEALDAYRHCRDILSLTLGVPPSAETQALYRTLTG